ncbi:hypothetical protein B7494_g4578 [Chlorociboria aeruginascens]|nr:hypothetical protein B7494_g4578 [Chlorociboria aeruginascens]
MLEALVAVSLAGNVVQFLQYAGELISQTKAIRRSGGPSSLPDLRKLTESLSKQACIIQTHLQAPNAAQPNPNQPDGVILVHSQEDQHLLDMALDYQQTGDKFLAYLNTLDDLTASPSMIRSAQLSIKFKWVQHKIEEFASKLDKFHSALSLATILALRARTDNHNQTILWHLQGLKADGQGQVAQGIEGTRALQALVDIIQSQSGPRLDTIQFEMQKCLGKIDDLRKELPQTREDAIMRWLNFRQMSWRYEEIPLAFIQTFQWIFQRARDDLWDDFTAHLTQKDVTLPYWINGKAGSGKSTLMKFIVDDPRTMEALRKWAGGEQLLVVKFFFWNLGTLLQKSNVGMLRSLIHSVLEKYPELIPVVFPDLYQNWEDSGTNSDADHDPSYIEIKKAFGLPIKKSSSFLKLCIFVDGIDEFEGDHRDISMFLRSLASNRIKIIVSSRPISGCVNAFRGCPTLRLQDLTKPDMETFVKGNLSSHRSMVDLTKRFSQQANEIVTEIKTKAAGVFLWVKIVVRLLVDGLEDGDDIKDLRNKLRQLPPDLRDLYRRMIAKMQPEHQTQAAEIFQLFHTWNLSIPDQPLRTVALSFAMQGPSEAFDLHKKMRGNLPAGLSTGLENLQISSAGKSRYAISDVDIESTIDYLHRTVAEFLVSDDVWKEISHDLSQYFRDAIAAEESKNDSIGRDKGNTSQIPKPPKYVIVSIPPSEIPTKRNPLRQTGNKKNRRRGDLVPNSREHMQRGNFQNYPSLNGSSTNRGVVPSTGRYRPPLTPAHGNRDIQRLNHNPSHHANGFRQQPLRQPQQYQYFEDQYCGPFNPSILYNSPSPPMVPQSRRTTYASPNPLPYSGGPAAADPTLPPSGTPQMWPAHQPVPVPYSTAKHMTWHQNSSGFPPPNHRYPTMISLPPQQGLSSPFDRQLHSC